MAYNAEMVGAEEAPQTWEDLLDPKWKGELALTDAASALIHPAFVRPIQSVYGKEFMEKLAAGRADADQRRRRGQRVGLRRAPGPAAIARSHASRAIGKGGALRIVVPEAGAPIVANVICIPARDQTGDRQAVRRLRPDEDVQVMFQNGCFSPSMRIGVPPIELDTGARPLEEVKPMASSQADLERFMAERGELMQEYMDLFK